MADTALNKHERPIKQHYRTSTDHITHMIYIDSSNNQVAVWRFPRLDTE
jgi:hypothetical protein